MKRFMYSAFVAFWASVVSIWAFAALATGGGVGSTDETAPPTEGITLETVAEHDTPDDCWMAIDGEVYDFTDYLDKHPAPPAVMNTWCGKEASEAYHTKGYGRDHSAAADAMLPQYRVGPLVGPEGARAP